MNNIKLGFALTGSILTIALLFYINYTYSRDFPWFIYPAFALLCWPAGVYFISRGRVKGLSIVGSIMILLFLLLINIVFSPCVLWVLFALAPLIWWPVTALLGKRASGTAFAVFSFFAAMLYYGLLNIFVFTGHPWVIYIAFALFWWPLSRHLARRRHLFALSVVGASISIVFFLAVNLITSTGFLWFVYPSFGILWWPLSVYFFIYKKQQA